MDEIRGWLQELHENFNLPAEKYRELKAFKELEKRKELVEDLIWAESPELVKLICLTDKIDIGGYQDIEPLYRDLQNIDMMEVLNRYESSESLEQNVWQFADIDILKKIQATLSDVVDRYCELTQRTAQSINVEKYNADLLGRAEAVSAEIPDELAEADSIKENEVCESVENSELIEMKRMMDKYRPLSEVLKKRIDNPEQDAERNKKYKGLLSILDKLEAEEFVKSLKTTGAIADKYKKRNGDDKFIQNVLDVLKQPENELYSVPILVKSHEAGVLKLNGGKHMKIFLLEQCRLVNDYLVQCCMGNIQSPVNGILVNSLIKAERECVLKRGKSGDLDFWNYIADKAEWKWLLQRICEIGKEQAVQMIVVILNKITAETQEVFLPVLFERIDNGGEYSYTDIIAALFNCGSNSIQTVIMKLVQHYEAQEAQKRRRIKALERQLREQSQELFAATYEAIEELEEIAVDYKNMGKNVASQVIGVQITNPIISLRQGLENMGIAPLTDIEAWSQQNSLSFNPEIHIRPIDEKENIEKVQLRTMGFQYKNEDGEIKQRKAIVAAEKEIIKRSGYPKYSKPGRKVSKGRADFSMDEYSKFKNKGC